MDELNEEQVRQIAAVIESWRQPWWWRARRRLAFFVGLTCRLPALGYLIDVDRDRHR